MKKISHFISPILMLIASVASGCSNGADAGVNAALESCDSIPQEIKRLARCLDCRDSAAFSGMISYPLERPYPLHDILDSVEMMDYYHVMVDDSLRSAVAKSHPSEWSRTGWRGWTLRDGSYVWIDEKVYEVGYLSAVEKSRRDALVDLDKASLPEDMRGNWLPENCMVDPEDGSVYRIDIDTVADAGSPVYRLAIYKRGGNLRHHPADMRHGRKRSDGSAGELTYLFKKTGRDKDREHLYRDLPVDEDDPSLFVIEAYSQETGAPRLYNDGEYRDLRRVYWLDLLSNDSIVGGEPKAENSKF